MEKATSRARPLLQRYIKYYNGRGKRLVRGTRHHGHGSASRSDATVGRLAYPPYETRGELAAARL